MLNQSNPVTFAACTYNMGNNSGYGPDAPDMIAGALSDADIVIVGVQESKNSVSQNQSFAERCLNRLSGYTILQDPNPERPLSVDVQTKPVYPWNWSIFKRSRTHLTIAYKQEKFQQNEITIVRSGQCVSNERDHKGGVYAILKVRGVYVAVINVHLDSFSEETRNQQMQELMREIYKPDEIKPDCVMAMGDFNLRLHKDLLNHNGSDLRQARNRDSAFVHADDTPANRKKLIEASLKRWQAEQDSALRDFDFLRVDEFTYDQSKGSKKVKPNPGRDHTYDMGALDKIGVRQTGVAVLFPQKYRDFSEDTPHSSIDSTRAPSPASVTKLNEDPSATIYRPKTSLGTDVSDHAAVVGHHVLYPVFKNSAAMPIATADTAATTSPLHEATDNSLGMDFTLVDKYLAFILRHLDVHDTHAFDKAALDHYENLIFGTCEKLETLTGNTGKYMLARYNQLFEVSCRDDWRIALLRPMREWFKARSIEHRSYQYEQLANGHVIFKAEIETVREGTDGRRDRLDGTITYQSSATFFDYRSRANISLASTVYIHPGIS